MDNFILHIVEQKKYHSLLFVFNSIFNETGYSCLKFNYFADEDETVLLNKNPVFSSLAHFIIICNLSNKSKKIIKSIKK